MKTLKIKLDWVDAFDPRLSLRGLGWLKENRKTKSFRRVPDRAAKSLSERVQTLSHHPSSAFVSFFSDSPTFALRLVNANAGGEVTSLMPLTGSDGAELFIRSGNHWLPLTTGIPVAGKKAFEQLLLTDFQTRGLQEYRLYLPLFNKLEKLAIGFTPGSKIKPAPAPAKCRPVLFYGTSITQGCYANTAGSDYVSHFGRLMDTEVINLGFAGSGKGEPEMATLIREIDAEIFVLDYVANCAGEALEKSLPEFVRILRAKHPRTPIVLMGPLSYNYYLWCERTEAIMDKGRDVMMEFYLRAKRDGDKNIHFIDGYGLISSGTTGVFVDGGHPTSAGYTQMAERLLSYFHKIRNRAKFSSR